MDRAYSRFRPISLATLLLSVGLVATTSAQIPPGFKPLPSKEEEKTKFHMPSVKGMSAEARLKGYQDRLTAEALAPFGNVYWRNVGPTAQGGRVQDIQWCPATPEKLYVAFATGGLWVTENEGISWTPLFDNESCFAIGSVAIGKDGKTIWVGTGEPNNQRTSYSGTGVFKSTDGGKTWQNMGLAETHRIGKVLIDPKNENTVYVAGTGHLYSENPERGVFKTTDGGKTWQHILKIDDWTGAIDLAMDPKNPDILIAAAYERARRAWNFMESGKGSAVYRSENGGKTWSKVPGLPSGTSMGRTGLASAPTKPGLFYAFVENAGPDPDPFSLDEGQPSGALTKLRFMRLNEEMFLQLETKVIEPFFRQYFPTDSKLEDAIAKLKSKEWKMADLYKLMEKRNPNVFQIDDASAEVYRSEDFGKTWKKAHSHRLGDMMGYYAHKIFVNPANENDVAIVGLLLYRSKDGGKTWKVGVNRSHVDHHAYWFSPKDPNFHLDGNDGGLYASRDGGKEWQHVNNLPVGQFTTIAVDNANPYNIVGGLQDNGTLMGTASAGGGRRFGDADDGLQTSPGLPGLAQFRTGAAPSARPSSVALSVVDWRVVGGGDGSAVAFDPRDNGVLYTASQFGSHGAANMKTNERWSARPVDKRGEPPLRFNWVSPFIVSPHHPDIVYCGGNKLFRSLNMGKNWEAISPDLTTKKENGDVPFSTIKELSESPLKFGLIYVGTDDGLVWVTKDHGGNWEEINTPSRGKWVSRVVASMYDVATIYCSQSGYREDDFAPYLWKSTDYGKTWTSIVGNLPTETINVIREDPSHKGTLYVGTDLGVWVSFNDGGKWEPLNGNIPRTPVHDLAVQPRTGDLVIGTHARSVWVLGVEPLFDLTEEIRKKDIHLWNVSDMRRDPRWGIRASSNWNRDTYAAPTVRGKFFVKAAGKARVAIKDKDGKVVKETAFDALAGYNNWEISLELETPKPVLDDPLSRDPKTLAEIMKDPYEDRRGKYLTAGEYTLEFTVGTVTATQKWKLTE